TSPPTRGNPPLGSTKERCVHPEQCVRLYLRLRPTRGPARDSKPYSRVWGVPRPADRDVWLGESVPMTLLDLDRPPDFGACLPSRRSRRWPAAAADSPWKVSEKSSKERECAADGGRFPRPGPGRRTGSARSRVVASWKRLGRYRCCSR